ncbi:MAG: beta-ketoacyl synthase chain length factor [Candidatus Spyradenecus sp.]
MPLAPRPTPLAIRRVATWPDLTQKPDLTFVPPLQRRRLSRLQAIAFHLAHELTDDLPPSLTERLPIIFGSRTGEDTLSRRIVADFHATGEVSPARFSTSVYNAAPGLYSIFAHNTAPYTAIAAGADTPACSLLEALMTAGPRLWILADEPGTPDACAIGALLDDTPAPGDALHALALPGSPTLAEPLATADLCAFFLGQTQCLRASAFTLCRTR